VWKPRTVVKAGAIVLFMVGDQVKVRGVPLPSCESANGNFGVVSRGSLRFASGLTERK